MTLTSSSAPALKGSRGGDGRKKRGPKLPSWIDGQNISLIGALFVVLVLFGVLNDNYLSLSNMQVIAEAATITGLLAIVQTVVIICAGLDISVGSQVGVASVVSAMVFTTTGSGALMGMAAAVAVGLAIGVLNGIVIVYGRVNPTIATLAGLAAY
ncbi:ABC transporter permease [Streptomyces cyaneofuscatus]|uniref:ABC transporter permease n=1 Tax=Streptomyces cyaneofuscatus TaxID=66883 RepID=UPI00365F43FB